MKGAILLNRHKKGGKREKERNKCKIVVFSMCNIPLAAEKQKRRTKEWKKYVSFMLVT